MRNLVTGLLFILTIIGYVIGFGVILIASLYFTIVKWTIIIVFIILFATGLGSVINHNK